MKSRHSLLPVAAALAACLCSSDAMAQAATIPVIRNQESRSTAHAGIATHGTGELPGTGDRPGTGELPGTAQPAHDAELNSAAALRRQAFAAMEMLREEIAILAALKNAQAVLLAWNRVGSDVGDAPEFLDAALCNDPALSPWCRLLPATFGTEERSGIPSPTAEESYDRD